ncbi:hypothetical protein J42TS3_23320 [Paenibacillus vini]|uniref:Uncharacterized protein n=1 Tax=Paenibacillus vini TaxID=1476024 RepID=A0ABQ4MBC8_9BACL|nr:hypothetical protein J42TS3_23320 [Paenibacillus vini]
MKRAREEVDLFVFAPKVMYENNNNLDISNPYIKINGYLNELERINHFHRGGDYQAMNEF